MNLNDNSEEFFRDKMKGHEFPFDENAWEKMEEMLDTNPSAQPLYKSWKYKLFMTGSVAIIVLSTLFSHTYFKNINNPVTISEIIDYTASQFTEDNAEITDLSYEYSFSHTPDSPVFLDFQTIERLKKIGGQLADLCCIDKIIKKEEAVVVFAKDASEGPFAEQISTKTKNYADYLKEEKVYIHFDRTYFQPGENVWFKTYVRDAMSFEKSEQSNVVYVQLLSPDKKILKTLSLVVKDGGAEGDFNLGMDAKKGRYIVRAFTNWQRNQNEYIERVIQVDTESDRLVWNVEFDKPFYNEEDEVQAKLKVRNGSGQSLPNQRFLYYLEIEDKKLVSQTSRTDKKGVANVKFNLPKEFASAEGILHIKIDGHRHINKKVVPGQLKNVDLQFMPEGGELIAGQNITTAFKAVNEFGNSVDVNGIIFNSSNKKVTTFTTYHAGMGGFQFTPKKNEKYYAKITSPVAVNKKYKLPQVLAEGYAIKLENRSKKKINLKLLTPNKKPLTLVVRSKDNIILTEGLDGENGWIDYSLSTNDWPIGIAQITLFDNENVPQSERLVFVNSNKQLKLEVSTDKQIYQPREKVTLTVSAKDENDAPVAGDFSLSVVDERLLKFANDKQGNILSYMLLESDLEGEIEDPNYYFDASKPKAQKALDYLVMTQGYRRFSWEEVQAPVADLNYPNELSVINGQILDVANQPIKNAIVKLIANTKEQQRLLTDEDGMFAFNDIDLRDAVRLDIEADECSPNWHPVFMYSGNLKLGLNPYPAMARDLTEYPSGYVPPMYPKQSRIVVEDAEYLKTVSEKLLLEEPRTEVVVLPAEFETTTTKMLVQPANKKSPAVYETVKEQILVKEATTTSKELPAKYETLTKQVTSQKRKNSISGLNNRGELKMSTNPEDWNLVKNSTLRHINHPLTQASYFKNAYEENTKDKNWVITKKNVKTPATNRVETSPAEYKTIVRKVEISPEGVHEVQIPAEYKTVYNPVLRIPATATTKAVFDTLQEEVLVKPAFTKIEKVPAKYKTAEEKILTRKGVQKSVSVAAEYSLEKKTVNEQEFNNYARKFKYGFYRARDFYSPKYVKKQIPNANKDNRKTLFWESNVKVNSSGTHTLSFYNGDETTSFVSVIEGFSANGQIGRGQHAFDSKMPIQIDANLPIALLKGDKFTIPVKVTNNLEETLIGKLKVVNPSGYKLLSEQLDKYSIDAQKTATILLEYEVVDKTSGPFSVEFITRGLTDKVAVTTNANYPGEDVVRKYAGVELNNSFIINLTEEEKMSLVIELAVYPNLQSELLEKSTNWSVANQNNLESTLSSMEPELLLLEQMTKGLLQMTNQKAIKAKLLQKLNALQQFEMEKGGFYSNNPQISNPVQTAVALSYLNRASNFVDVDSKLIDRNLKWILDQKDGKGGWKIDQYQIYEGIDKSILEASIVWALSEAGYKQEISKELEHTLISVSNSNDSYLQILASLALINIQDVRGTELLTRILELQQSNGSWIGNSHTYTNKIGRIQSLETTSLVIFAINKTYTGSERLPAASKFLRESVDFIVDTPASESAFVLKALAQIQNISSITEEDVSIIVNGKTVSANKLKLDQNEPLKIKGLAKHLKVGENLIEIRFNQEKLNHQLRSSYIVNSSTNADRLTPPSVKLTVNMSDDKVEQGKMLPFKIELVNLKEKIVPSPSVKFQIPGGLALEHWQLEKLKAENKILDYSYQEGTLVLILDHLQPNQKSELELGLRAKIEGNFIIPNIFVYSNQKKDSGNAIAGSSKAISVVSPK